MHFLHGWASKFDVHGCAWACMASGASCLGSIEHQNHNVCVCARHTDKNDMPAVGMGQTECPSWQVSCHQISICYLTARQTTRHHHPSRPADGMCASKRANDKCSMGRECLELNQQG
eukprot:scaffold109276_cov21-Tisochrysis_lutea.AAC.6